MSVVTKNPAREKRAVLGALPVTRQCTAPRRAEGVRHRASRSIAPSTLSLVLSQKL